MFPVNVLQSPDLFPFGIGFVQFDPPDSARSGDSGGLSAEDRQALSTKRSFPAGLDRGSVSADSVSDSGTDSNGLVGDLVAGSNPVSGGRDRGVVCPTMADRDLVWGVQGEPVGRCAAKPKPGFGSQGNRREDAGDKCRAIGDAAGGRPGRRRSDPDQFCACPAGPREFCPGDGHRAGLEVARDLSNDVVGDGRSCRPLETGSK